MVYRVFISHGWHDRWVARQMARLVHEDSKAEPFIDIFDVKKGDRIEERIFQELPKCRELVALLTPWSVTRNWVWNEIGAAWILNLRIVAVLYGVTLAEIEAEKGGRACLTSRNAVLLDDFDDYIDELAVRVKGAS
jgi:TIR domain